MRNGLGFTSCPALTDNTCTLLNRLSREEKNCEEWKKVL